MKLSLINPNVNWGEDPDYPDHSINTQFLGMPVDGTMAEYLSIPLDRIHPDTNTFVFRRSRCTALGRTHSIQGIIFNKGQLKEDDKVLISGIGGGVALMAFQFAVAIGAEVYVTSSKGRKFRKAIESGCKLEV